MTSSQPGVFDRSGFASLSDLGSERWREIFALLEDQQREFLAHEKNFRSPQYQWPRDPLHNWSRVWEYPYAHHQLRQWRASLPPAPRPRVADIGSGVTFFPFSVARLGCEVVGTDVDPVCATDLGRAQALVSAGEGRVDFRPTDGRSLPFAEAELDAAYSISVIEHIPEFGGTIREIHRTLKPGGLFLLTCDVATAATEYDSLGPEALARLRSILADLFVPAAPELSVHPEDLLRADNSPRLGPPPPAPPGWGERLRRHGLDLFRHPVRSARRARELLFPPSYPVPQLTVIAFCLRKKIAENF